MLRHDDTYAAFATPAMMLIATLLHSDTAADITRYATLRHYAPLSPRHMSFRA